MGLFQKLKGVLFDEEEETEQIKITPEMRNEDTPARETVVAPKKEEVKEDRVEVKKTPEPVSERELFKTESSFPFFDDFDEDEFKREKAPEVKPNIPPQKFATPAPKPKSSLDYEINHKTVVKTDYGRFEKTVTTEERKKFKPSPIISPVYGILNKDYQKEDIVKKSDLDNIDIQKVRDKAFGETKKVTEKIELHKGPASVENPKTTYYEETITVKAPEKPVEPTVKSIDELLEETSDITASIDRDLENTIPDMNLELPRREEFKEEVKEEIPEIIPDTHIPDETEDTLENDLFDLIDSMYDNKED